MEIQCLLDADDVFLRDGLLVQDLLFRYFAGDADHAQGLTVIGEGNGLAVPYRRRISNLNL